MRLSDAPIIDRPDRGFAAGVRAGLTVRGQKQIPAQYLYDEVGSALFDAITVLPEYGLTRADIRLLQGHAADLSRLVEPSIVVELGSGGGGKARWALRELSAHQEVHYYPVDLSASALRRCELELSGIENLRITPIEALYQEGLETALRLRQQGATALVLFLGSSVGNFDPAETEAFLRSMRRELLPSDWFLLSTDLQKDRARMLAAYDDSLGVTAAFNLNLLARINRELGGDFDLKRFEHVIRYDDCQHRIEMHLRSQSNQVVSIGSTSIGFSEDETIWTESSYKFRREDIQELARKSGFRCVAQWVDEEWPFAQSLLRAI